MDYSHLATAIAMIAIGVSFRPLGWLALLGSVVLLLAAIEFARSYWLIMVATPVLLIPIALLCAFIMDKLDEKDRTAKDIERYKSLLDVQPKSREMKRHRK